MKRTFILFSILPLAVLAQTINDEQPANPDFNAIYLVNSNAIEIQSDLPDNNMNVVVQPNYNPQQQEINNTNVFAQNEQQIVSTNYTQGNSPRTGYTGGGGSYSSSSSKKSTSYLLKKRALKFQKKMRKIFRPSNKKKKSKSKCFSW